MVISTFFPFVPRLNAKGNRKMSKRMPSKKFHPLPFFVIRANVNTSMLKLSDVINSPLFDTSRSHSVCDLTLTLKQARRSSNGSWVRIDQNKAKDAFRHFMRLVNGAVYGKANRRFNKRIMVLPVLEKDNEGRFHIHAAIELPKNCDPVWFDETIRKCWSKVHWAYDQTCLRENANRRWLNYMLKHKRGQKSGLEAWSDCIVWECINPIVGA
jgi:hypothetical protein